MRGAVGWARAAALKADGVGTDTQDGIKLQQLLGSCLHHIHESKLSYPVQSKNVFVDPGSVKEAGFTRAQGFE